MDVAHCCEKDKPNAYIDANGNAQCCKGQIYEDENGNNQCCNSDTHVLDTTVDGGGSATKSYCCAKDTPHAYWTGKKTACCASTPKVVDGHYICSC